MSTFQTSFSGDWGLQSGYCFGPNGAIRRMESQRRMLPFRTITNWTVYYDSFGREVFREATYRDLESGRPLTGKEVGSTEEYNAIRPIVYKRLKDLPFSHLLVKRR